MQENSFHFHNKIQFSTLACRTRCGVGRFMSDLFFNRRTKSLIKIGSVLAEIFTEIRRNWGRNIPLPHGFPNFLSNLLGKIWIIQLLLLGLFLAYSWFFSRYYEMCRDDSSVNKKKIFCQPTNIPSVLITSHGIFFEWEVVDSHLKIVR